MPQSRKESGGRKQASGLYLLFAGGLIVIGGGLTAMLAAFKPKPVGPSRDKAPVALPAKRVEPTPTSTPAALEVASWAQRQVIHKVPVRSGDKVIALTFDDGPWPHYTKQILKVLKENKVKATFFMVGEEVSSYPEIGRAVRDDGHAIGNHSWNHPSRPGDAIAQVQRTDEALHRVIGYTPHLFRPPFGLLHNGMADQAKRENDAILLWSADPDDWKRPGASAIASVITNQASPGGIALMHDGGGDRSQTVEALPHIIHNLQSRGYRFVTVPELLQMRYLEPEKPKAEKPKKAAEKSSKVSRQVHRA